VYQKALVAELWNHGAKTVEFEKNVPVFYTDTRGVQHTVGSERIDILLRYVHDDQARTCLMELKATASAIRNQVEVQQLRKYHHALQQMHIVCDDFYIINFSQGMGKDQVDVVYFDQSNIDG
jgi:hypothetical protein